MLNNRFSALSWLAWFSLLFMPLKAGAEAYCALRDPVSSIQALFPEATSHRSIVRTIDEQTRQQVLEKLPQLPLHFGELGRHTLYVAVRGEEPIGLVHVRSEQSSTGLVEIAWAMNMDLTIKDFVFQRCRSRKKKLLDTAEFKLQFMGQDFSQVQAYYDADNNQGRAAYLQYAQGANELADVVLRCALKTLVVTSLAWEQDLIKLNNHSTLKQLGLSEVQLVNINQLMGADTLKKLEQVMGSSGLGIDRNKVAAYEVRDAKQQIQALLYLAQTTIDQQVLYLSWLFDLQGTVLAVESLSGWPSDDIQAVFQQTRSQHFSNTQECSNRAELYALEATLTLAPYFKRVN